MVEIALGVLAEQGGCPKGGRGLSELKIPVFPVLLVLPVFLAGVTGITGVTGEFERSLFSGRCAALQRRGAGEIVALSNLFERGLLFWLQICLQRQSPRRKGYTKSFWFRFLQKAEKKVEKKEKE